MEENSLYLLMILMQFKVKLVFLILWQLIMAQHLFCGVIYVTCSECVPEAPAG